MTNSPPGPGKHRIAKLLARAGVASRREVERMIADRRIALNGVVVETPATLLETVAGLTVDGVQVDRPEEPRVWAFHKPPGCLTTDRDPKGRKTVYDLLPRDMPRVLAIGRLDYATEGLLLFTNDGELKRRLELPANAVERVYRVRVRGKVPEALLAQLADGITIDGMNYGSIIADVDRARGLTAWLSMSLREGKNREIRRVLEHFDLPVARLIRIAYGPVELDELKPGEIVELHPATLGWAGVKERPGVRQRSLKPQRREDAPAAEAARPARKPAPAAEAGTPGRPAPNRRHRPTDQAGSKAGRRPDGQDRRRPSTGKTGARAGGKPDGKPGGKSGGRRSGPRG